MLSLQKAQSQSLVWGLRFHRLCSMPPNPAKKERKGKRDGERRLLDVFLSKMKFLLIFGEKPIMS